MGVPTTYTPQTLNPTAYTAETLNKTQWVVDSGQVSYGNILQEDNGTILTEDGNNTIAQE